MDFFLLQQVVQNGLTSLAGYPVGPNGAGGLPPGMASQLLAAQHQQQLSQQMQMSAAAAAAAASTSGAQIGE